MQQAVRGKVPHTEFCRRRPGPPRQVLLRRCVSPQGEQGSVAAWGSGTAGCDPSGVMCRLGAGDMNGLCRIW